MRNTSLALSLVLAGCELSQTGARGNVDFSMSDCGYIACDMSLPMAVGGSVTLHAHTLDGSDAPLLLAGDNYALHVAEVSRNEATIIATAPGGAVVSALLSGGGELDYLHIDTAEPTGLIVRALAASKVTDSELVTRFAAPVGDAVDLRVTGSYAYGELLGVLSLGVGIDRDLLATAYGNLSEGDFQVTALPGVHVMTLALPNGHVKYVEVEGY